MKPTSLGLSWQTEPLLGYYPEKMMYCRPSSRKRHRAGQWSYPCGDDCCLIKRLHHHREKVLGLLSLLSGSWLETGSCGSQATLQEVVISDLSVVHILPYHRSLSSLLSASVHAPQLSPLPTNIVSSPCLTQRLHCAETLLLGTLIWNPFYTEIAKYLWNKDPSLRCLYFY